MVYLAVVDVVDVVTSDISVVSVVSFFFCCCCGVYIYIYTCLRGLSKIYGGTPNAHGGFLSNN